MRKTKATSRFDSVHEKSKTTSGFDGIHEKNKKYFTFRL